MLKRVKWLYQHIVCSAPTLRIGLYASILALPGQLTQQVLQHAYNDLFIFVLECRNMDLKSTCHFRFGPTPCMP